MLKSSQVNKVVVEEFESKKGSGAGKLACPLRDKSNRHRNAKFQNKAKLKSVRARDVHVKHRIYLMDMNRKGSAKMNGHLYQYSLTVIDVFSRLIGFVIWKANQPRKLQVKWNVFTWSIDRQKYSVRPRRGVQESTLRWHEYKIHLQSPTPSQITRQGRMLTQDNKIRDGISPSKMGQDGLDSTNSSLLYQRILNNNYPTEVKAYETPFEIYIARKCNAFRKSRLQDKILLVLGGFALKITVTGVLGKRGNYESKLKKATSRLEKRRQRTQHRRKNVRMFDR